MKVYQTKEIRNIAVIGGNRTGKTTLCEAMAFHGGVISRRGTVEDKNTLSDYRGGTRKTTVYPKLRHVRRVQRHQNQHGGLPRLR